MEAHLDFRKMTSIKFYSLLLYVFLCTAGAAAQGYRIKVQVKPAVAGHLYLAYYYGERKLLQDSARIDATGTAVFQGKEKLPGGLYLLVNPGRSKFFDLIIDKEQQFSLVTDTSFEPSKVIFTNSAENQHLQNYQVTTAAYFQSLQQWQEKLAKADNATDSAAIQQNIQKINQNTLAWREDFIRQHPDSYLALLFRLLREPEYKLPAQPTREDSLKAYYLYKQQFWKDIPVGDDRLLRTPMFEARLNRYMEQLVVRHPDSLKLEVDRFILSSRNNKNMFRYYVTRFTNEYMNPKYMGLDVVFLHLFEKYYLTNQVDWLEEKDRELVYNRAYSLMGNIVGQPAADMQLLDTSDFMFSLYTIRSPYTVVVFWDPDCGHCREEVPKMDSLYRSKWKLQGVSMVGVLVDTIRTDFAKMKPVKENWMKFIREKKLENWYHGYQTPQMREADRKANRPGIRQLYDVYSTPTIYLLDNEKRIIAKKLTPEQITEVLEAKQNLPSSGGERIP